MKKNYAFPVLEEVKIEIEDVIAASGTIGEKQPGDVEGPFFNEEVTTNSGGFYSSLFE